MPDKCPFWQPANTDDDYDHNRPGKRDVTTDLESRQVPGLANPVGAALDAKLVKLWTDWRDGVADPAEDGPDDHRKRTDEPEHPTTDIETR